MNKLSYKLATAASTAALLLGSFGPSAFGTTTFTINGNGADSTNKVEWESSNQTFVTQSNTANISNSVHANASTGKNDTNRNTGGDNKIDTGDATSNASVTNMANANMAKVDNCCLKDATVKITGNGANSDNTIDLDVNSENTKGTVVTQTNEAWVSNWVDSDAKTGKNDANRNTGGNNSIETGNATSGATVVNKLNANWAQIGSGNGGGTLDVEISGNGADSTNLVELELSNEVFLTQSNTANVNNYVDADASTGGNDANRNTGGENTIDTGNAHATASVANLANFNGADLSSCDCILDLKVKVAGNGEGSDNNVDGTLTSGLLAVQSNDFNCGESREWILDQHSGDCAGVDANAKTGGNDSNRNTGDPGEDGSITTGNATTDVTVETTANANVLGDVNFDFPDLDLGMDLNALIVFLMAHISHG